MRIVCAWCSLELVGGRRSDPVSHGICAECSADVRGLPVVSLADLTYAELDQLPYGLIRLDGANRVIAYNRAESALAHRSAETVIGRHFFEEVAPCTNVAEIAYGTRPSSAG